MVVVRPGVPVAAVRDGVLAGRGGGEARRRYSCHQDGAGESCQQEPARPHSGPHRSTWNRLPFPVLQITALPDGGPLEPLKRCNDHEREQQRRKLRQAEVGGGGGNRRECYRGQVDGGGAGQYIPRPGPPASRSLARNTTAPASSASPQAPATVPAKTAGGAAGPADAAKTLDEMARLSDPAPKPANPVSRRTAGPAWDVWASGTAVRAVGALRPAGAAGRSEAIPGDATARPGRRRGTCPGTGPRRGGVRRWRGGGRCRRRSGR
ncbi:hypothetical protein FBY36_3250 [Arthrobacter sp. SLBN-122]|nr:hypothetical protein FBY36_3250 [Arthrobacter sp. SLBN-122]